MKDNCKPSYLDSGIDIGEIHGHMDIVLTDVKTGEVQEIHEDNLITNAIQQYFVNCGFMNYPNLDKNTLVEQLLGGVMLFDDNISEDATIIHAPAGLHMIANAAQGYTNNVPNVEQGTATANDGSTGTVYNGWQPDGSYLHTYEWNTTQGNGTIACVCLANKEYAWAGEGNSVSGTRHATKTNIVSLQGSVTSHSGVVGTPFSFNLTDSSCYTFSIEDVEVEDETVKKGFVRKYRLPISKLNIKGKPTAPIELSKTEVTLDEDIKTASLLSQNLGNNLLLWNVQDGAAIWGDTWTQYLWTVTSTGTISKQTVVNATGDSLYGLQLAHFDGNYCFFISPTQQNPYYVDSTKIYVWNRQTNAMTAINNPYGRQTDGAWAVNWRDKAPYVGWVFHRGTGTGRILTLGASYSSGFITDVVEGECYPMNNSDNYIGNMNPTSAPLILANGLNLYRDQTYIGSINNLANPVYKTSEKTMKLTYRITFDEE